MIIPRSLEWLRNRPGGPEWLENLSESTRRQCLLWDLQLDGAPFDGGHTALVLPVVRQKRPLALKLQFPDPEVENEATALAEWNGDGAVRLVKHDSNRHALLLERCIPGEPLANCTQKDPLGTAIEILVKLTKPTQFPYRALNEEAAKWANGIPLAWERAGRPCETALLDTALDHLDELLAWDGEPVLLNQDLHGLNILNSERGWLAIDPKPLRGDPDFSGVSLLRSFELGHSEKEVLSRLDRLTETLGCNRDRLRRWCLLQTLAWAFCGPCDEQHQQTCRWLAKIK